MHVLYFLEDNAHAKFVPVLFRRLADEAGVDLIEKDYGPMGGAGPTIKSIRQMLVDIESDSELQPDALVVGIDADCSQRGERSRQVRDASKFEHYGGMLVVAEPEPHIESWYLADPTCIQRLLRIPDIPPAPDTRCRKQDYKNQLRSTVRSSGRPAPLGGVEYGQEIASTMNLYRAGRNVPSLRRFVRDARECLRGYAARRRGEGA